MQGSQIVSPKQRLFRHFWNVDLGNMVIWFRSEPRKLFFDEDPTRVGSKHMGLPVFAPKEIPQSTDVFIPLIPEIAAAVAERLRVTGTRCYVPPEIDRLI